MFSIQQTTKFTNYFNLSGYMETRNPDVLGGRSSRGSKFADMTLGRFFTPQDSAFEELVVVDDLTRVVAGLHGGGVEFSKQSLSR